MCIYRRELFMVKQEEAPCVLLGQLPKGVVLIRGQPKCQPIEVQQRALHRLPACIVGLGQGAELYLVQVDVLQRVKGATTQLAQNLSQGIAAHDDEDAIHEVERRFTREDVHVVDGVDTTQCPALMCRQTDVMRWPG